MSISTNKINIVNELLMQAAKTINNNSLLNGKMGMCIYFFHLARETGQELHQEFAENLIDNVIQEVSKGRTIPDFENGLAGIAWGFEYLEKNGFVEADTDIILSDLDDQIYKFIVTTKDLPPGVLQGAMGFILYLLSRIEGKDIHSESSDMYIFKRLLIDLINSLAENIENRKFVLEEPLLFDVSWDLPLFLFLIGKIGGLNFYNTKLERILDHLTPIVLSLNPRLTSNRLYILLGMESVNSQFQRTDWIHHANFLKQNIELRDILHGEFKNKNLNLLGGLTGISLISSRLYHLINDDRFVFNKEDLEQKIISSEYWQDLESDELTKKNLGLLTGLAGIGIKLLELSKNNPEIIM